MIHNIPVVDKRDEKKEKERENETGYLDKERGGVFEFLLKL